MSKAPPLTIGVAIIDEQPLFRDGVAHVLSRSKVFHVVGHAASAADLSNKKIRPEITILRRGTQHRSLEAAKMIARQWPSTKIVVLAEFHTKEHVRQTLAAGVAGCLPATTRPDALIDALHLVVRGERYVAPTLAGNLLASSKILPCGLTGREEQVLDRVARGLTNQEIATDLQVREKTIKHYMTAIMDKLCVRNRVEAALTYRGVDHHVASWASRSQGLGDPKGESGSDFPGERTRPASALP